MFWNRAKKTKAPYEVPKASPVYFELAPRADITVLELIEILQHYVPGKGTGLPNGKTEIPVGLLPPHVMRHLRRV